MSLRSTSVLTFIFTCLITTVNFCFGESEMRQRKMLEFDLTSFDDGNNDFGAEMGHGRELQRSATGFFRNYGVSWSVVDLAENFVEMELFVEVVLSSGSLDTFTMSLMDKRFGDVVDTPIVELENQILSSSKVGLSVNNDGAYRSQVQLDRVYFGGESFFLKYFYNATDVICSKKDGKQGIAGTWASLVEPRTDNIEYDFSLPTDIKGDFGGQIDFNPKVSSFSVKTTNVSTSLFVAYDSGQLDFGKPIPKEVFFSWDPKIFTGELRRCAAIKQSYFFIYVLASIPAAACVCLVIMALIQRYTDDRAERRGGVAGAFRLGHIFPGSRDIVLSPTNNETTVRAVLENEDDVDLDAMVPVTTINVEIDNLDDTGLGGAVNSGAGGPENEIRVDLYTVENDAEKNSRNVTKDPDTSL